MKFKLPLIILVISTAIFNFTIPAIASPIANYQTFIPLVSSGPATEPRAGAGVPLERDNTSADMPAVMASWYYNWAATSPSSTALAAKGIQFVPMSYAGGDPGLPANYSDFLLVFNEPDVSGQANLSPAKAADRYLALLDKYPLAKLVVGGVSVMVEWYGWSNCQDGQGRNSKSWMTCFLGEFDRRGVPQLKPIYWHAHAYLNEGISSIGYLTPQRARQTLEALHAKTGGTYWITEYAEVRGDTAVFCTFTEWMKDQSWIARYAPFASRVAGNEPWYPSEFWGAEQHVSLIDAASPTTAPILSEMGSAYTACGN